MGLISFERGKNYLLLCVAVKAAILHLYAVFESPVSLWRPVEILHVEKDLIILDSQLW